MNRIVAYGCSYTAGSELVDHLVDPNHDRIKVNLGWRGWHDHCERLGHRMSSSEWLGRSMRLAWPAKLGKQLGVSVLNRAFPGSSLAWSVYQLERDLTQGSVSHRDCVIVGVTRPNRCLHLSDEREDAVSYMIQSPDTWPNPDWHVGTLLETHTHRQSMYDHLGLLLRLCQLFPHIHLVNMSDPPQYEQAHDPVIQSRLEELTAQNRMLDRTLVSFVENPQEFHGGNHPRECVHDRFALWLKGVLS